MRNTSDTQSEEFAKAMLLVKQQFVDSLCDRILQIEAHVQEINVSGVTGEVIRAIATCCHKLAGTAPSLGFQKIGDEARRLENGMLKTLEEQGADQVWREYAPLFEVFMDQLEVTLDAGEGNGDLGAIEIGDGPY